MISAQRRELAWPRWFVEALRSPCCASPFRICKGIWACQGCEATFGANERLEPDLRWLENDGSAGEAYDVWDHLQRNGEQSYLNRPQSNCTTPAAPYFGELVDILGSAPGGSVLDVGCGPMGCGEYIPGSAVRSAGVEPLLRRIVSAWPCVRAVGEALPFAASSWDTVLCISMLDHVIDPRRVLDECRRVARRRVYAMTHDPAPSEALVSAGLVSRARRVWRDEGIGGVWSRVRNGWQPTYKAVPGAANAFHVRYIDREELVGLAEGSGLKTLWARSNDAGLHFAAFEV